MKKLRWYLIPALAFFAISAFKTVEILKTTAGHDPVPVEDFVNFESGHVHPLDMTPDGSKLLAVNTAANTLEVFTVTITGLVNTASIPVGMDPVTVRVRNNDEAWVANVISDNVSIVDLNQEVVVRTLWMDDMNEPSDIVFAGTPQRAFVSCAERESIFIFDLNNLDANPQEVLLIGEQPRAMAVSPDGNTVYTAFFESGNQTTVVAGNQFVAAGNLREPVGNRNTVIPNDVTRSNGPYGGAIPIPNNGNSFNPPMNPNLPNTSTFQSLVVKKDNSSGQWLDDNGGNWTSIVSGGQGARQSGWDLQDRDVAVLNANSLNLSYQEHLGNILMAMDVNPVSGKVSVVGTDALNHIRFTPNLNGTFLRVNISQFDQGNNNNDITDLNDHLDYSTPSVSPSERQKSVGDPRAIVWKSNGQEAYISGMGSNNLIIVDANGDRMNAQPIEVGQGPTGIVLDESNSKVYVLNKFDASISTVDMSTDQEIAQTSFFDPTPNEIKIGRPHMYDTHLGSGNGTIACASCHVDGKWDRLAWDLGDPSGSMETVNGVQFHPLKGLKVTQSLIDIINVGDGLLHWRGDIDDFEDFSSAFDALQGTAGPLPSAEMQEFEDFLSSTYHPPNPYRGHRFNQTGFGYLNQDKVRGPGTSFIRARFATNNDFPNTEPMLDSNYGFLCGGCHELGSGRGSTRYNGNENMSADLRSTYRKLGFYLNSTESTAGFGMLADGIMDTDMSCVGNCTNEYFIDYEPVILTFAGGAATDRDLSQANTTRSPFGFVQAHESQDSHGATGHQATLSPNAGTTAAVNNVRNLANEYTKLGLIVKGIYQGDLRGFLYLGNNTYQADSAGQTVTHNQLLSAAQNSGALTWMVVHNDIAERLGIDRNSNGVFDFDETISADFTYNREEPYDIPAIVDFDGSASNNPIGNSTSFAWDFGDGNTAIGINPTHSYAAADTFIVTLTVTDDNSGESDVTSKQVIIIDGCAALVGQSCNDPCMPDGIIQPDCSCLGTPTTDSDGDGVCDATDQCPNFDNNLIGTPCDDGDVCTINDTWLSSCNCAGTVVDTDQDGVCDGIDIDDDNDGIADVEEGGCEGGTIAMDALTFSGNAIRSSTSDNLELNSQSGYTTSYSSETFELPIHLEFRFPGSGEQMFGFLPLGANQTPGNWNDGAYKFYASGTGLYGKFPNTWVPSNRPFNPNDLLEIDIDASGNLEAKHDGTVVATASLSQTEFSLAVTTRGGIQNISDILLSYSGGECEELDTDGDNIVNRLDLDSDGDGCSDLAEAGAGLVSESLVTENASFTSVGANGFADHLETSVDSDEPNYTSRYTEYAIESSLNGCADTDGDGVGDPVDIDDDNDGITDFAENGCSGSASDIDEFSFSGSAIVSSTSNSMALQTGNTWRSSYSSELLELPIHLEFTMPSSGNIMFGLLPEGASQTPSGWSDGSYKFYLAGSAIYGKFPTAWNPNARSYSARQLLEIDIAGDGTFLATHNGTVVFTGTAPQSDYQLVVSSYDGRTVSNIEISHGGGGCDQLVDTDGDGIVNQLDLDSDGDGCSDMAEAGSGLVTESLVTESSSFTSVGANGLADHLETSVDSDEISYNNTYGDYALDNTVNACADSDGDGIGDIVDIDDDNDGVLDVVENSCSGGDMGPNDMNWTGGYNPSISGNSISSSTSGWRSVYGDEPLSFPIHLEFRFTSSNSQVMFGLIPSSGSQTPTNWSDGAYKMSVISNGNLYRYFPGTNGRLRTDNSFNVLIEMDIDESGNLVVNRNGTQVTTATVPQEDFFLALSNSSSSDITDILVSSAGGCDNFNTDLDGDGWVNSLDLDSDGDGCSDMAEAGSGLVTESLVTESSSFTSVGANGLADHLETSVDSDEISYPSTYAEYALADSLNACQDTDNDGIGDIADLDDDNDGITDLEEANCSEGGIADISTLTFSGSAVSSSTSNSLSLNAPQSYRTSYSSETFVLPIHLEFRMAQSSEQMFGLLPVGAIETINGWNDGSYKFYVSGSSLYGKFPTTWNPSARGFSASHLLEIDIDESGNLTATQNGTIVFTGTAPQAEYRLAVTANRGNSVSDIVLSHDGGECIDLNLDTDGDGIVNSLDLDSDGDGCSDAFEGSAGLAAGDINPDGSLSGSVNTNPNSGAYGIPTIAGAGQEIGTSHDSTDQPVNCPTLSNNIAPVANFTATPTGGEAPLFVSFDANASSDDVGIVNYAWVFGDGATGNGITATHTYNTAGTYTARLTVSDVEGLVDVATTTITVSEPVGNQAPVARFTATPGLGEAPLPVSFDANASSDDGGVVNYVWDFGDGNTGSGVTANHTYTNVGEYTVTLTVADQEGLTSSKTSLISVVDSLSNDCFIVNNIGEVWIEAEHYSSKSTGTGNASGSSWTVYADSAAANDSAMIAGPNNGVFTDLNTNGPRLDYNIYFDTPGSYAVFVRAAGPDGADDSFHAGLNGTSLTSNAGYGMSVPANWTWAEEANDGLDVILNIPSSGSYTFNLWMREDGVSVDKIFLIPAGGNGPFQEGELESETGPCNTPGPNTAPIASFSATPPNGDSPLPVSFDASASTDDKGIVSYAWDFGDGNTGNGATVDHTYALAGVYSAVLTIADQEGLTDIMTVSITVTDPVVEDCYLIDANGEVWIEAENYSAAAPGSGNASGSSWISYSDGSASGGTAVRAEPNDGVFTGLSANGPRLDYNIYFPSAGSYTVYVRGQGPTGSDDSFHAGLNGNPLTTTSGYGMSVPTSWTWAEEANDGVDVVLTIPSAGKYTFNLWMREDGVSVDKIFLIPQGGNGPFGTGELESAKGSCGGQVSNQAPVASFTATPPSGPAPLAVNFDANASSDDNGIVSYSWDFGDGNTGSGVTVDHTYTTVGQFTAELTVTDADGLTHSITSIIEVQNVSTESCFAEVNGEVVIEAENFSDLSPGTGNASASTWNLITDPNASGGEALEAGPNDGVWTGLNTNGPRLDYNIDFSETGVYRIYILTSAPGPNDDSYHVGLDGSSVSSNSGWGMSRNGAWGWADYANEDDFVEVNVASVGKHTFNVWMREDGVQIDKIILSKTNYPTGQGPAESGQSPCGGDANQAPVASFSATPSSGFAPLDVSIDASASTDPDGSIASYSWSFGDGNSGSGQTINHTYTSVGSFTLALTVTDNEGLTSQSSRTITVSPDGNGALCHQETAGVVVMEAENYTSTSSGTGNASGSSWQVITDPNTSNGEGVKAMPNANVYTGLNTNGPRLDYDITFQTAGTYRVYIRANGPTGTDDSFHAGLNGQSVTSATGYGMGYTGTWFWAEEGNEDPFVEVVVPSTGQHTFNIWMREDGVEIDKIVLKVQPGTPSGQGPTESALAECANQTFTNEVFSVEEEGGNADLNWGNFFEEFKDNYVLERSVDGMTYEQLEAQEISVDKLINEHTDPDIHQYEVNRIFYRLRIKDGYGRTRKERSGVLNLRTGYVGFALKAYPNPAKEKLNVEYDNTSGKPLSLKVMSALGQTVHRESLDGQETHGILKLDVEKYAEGIYFVQLTDGESSQVIRILVE